MFDFFRIRKLQDVRLVRRPSSNHRSGFLKSAEFRPNLDLLTTFQRSENRSNFADLKISQKSQKSDLRAPKWADLSDFWWLFGSPKPSKIEISLTSKNLVFPMEKQWLGFKTLIFSNFFWTASRTSFLGIFSGVWAKKCDFRSPAGPTWRPKWG